MERFGKLKRESDGCVATYQKAKQEYERDLKQAELNSKQFQLEAHLDGFLIRNAKLKAITDLRVFSLESFGIESAKDVASLKNQKVPGIGPVLTTRLFEWRQTLESGFSPRPGLPEVEKSRIASRYAPLLLPVGQTLDAAHREMEGVISSHQTREKDLIKAIAAAAQYCVHRRGSSPRSASLGVIPDSPHLFTGFSAQRREQSGARIRSSSRAEAMTGTFSFPRGSKAHSTGWRGRGGSKGDILTAVSRTIPA